MGAHFRAAHVLVSTCPKEQRPLSLLEAISCGLPILGPDSGGVKELVEHEQSGLLVTPSDPVALSQAMIRVANDVELYRRLRDRTLSLSQYQSWELCSREMLQTWQNLPGNA
jgi:glycosyltransferase involved in cell wall biosynthesis